MVFCLVSNQKEYSPGVPVGHFKKIENSLFALVFSYSQKRDCEVCCSTIMSLFVMAMLESIESGAIESTHVMPGMHKRFLWVSFPVLLVADRAPTSRHSL